LDLIMISPQSGAFASVPGPGVDEWPLSSQMELGALPTAVPCARLHARHVLWEWRMERVAETAELLVSELVTNSVQASERLRTIELPVVRLWLGCDRARVLIRAWDGSDEMPVRRSPDPGEISGRGLMLVEMLAAEWGCETDVSGKTTWALLKG
jgi:anti-sigma regulatory factor (Ser/Thr protein kinase)